MLTSREIRQTFLDFFKQKGHKIVASAPLVNKDDPTLMFINAGMNQFKDSFLGNQAPPAARVADTQKCLRVSGKHNDLEEVGRDSYHHTLFEMLGNWSFGDYFKEKAIDWAWELLTEVYKLPKDRLYVSIFEGDEKDGLKPDTEAGDFWKKYVSEDRILLFDKSDNFWEMGETGPCGPCSEIHIDLRDDADRAKVNGRDLVNMDDPLVVEIWNLVFIQFNRKADGSLEDLPDKHIDTGMGFERLAMAIQGTKSNYDTDIFTPYIEAIEKASGITYTSKYEEEAKTDIAMRVVADHLRAVSLAIADGQLPGNNGAGYVIRRILRRAIRYYFSFLNIDSPFIHTLVPLLSEQMGDVFPELAAQKEQVAKIIEGEEKSFLNTLANGIKRLDVLKVTDNQISGKDAFELYDTFGFPIDLTRLIASEKGWTIDEKGFEKALSAQKERARADAKKEVGDWTVVEDVDAIEFVGYDSLEVTDTKVVKYRVVQIKNKPQYQIVLNKTPFYAESGGQVGDKGTLVFGDEKISVIDTQKENDLSIHIVNQFPDSFDGNVKAVVKADTRLRIEQNHSAAHLFHAALHQVIGKNALQKGQHIDDKRLRFDFAHFQKLSDEEIATIERVVNEKIREDIKLEEAIDVPIEQAKELGAMMLFGEKYGEKVRVITYDKNFSSELCGGTHVPSTGRIGLFKIITETSVASGIRRIEGITADTAEKYVNDALGELQEVRSLMKTNKGAQKQVSALLDENRSLKKQIEKLLAAQAGALKGTLKEKVEIVNGVNFLAASLPLTDSGAIKTLAFQLEKEVGDVVIALGAVVKDKPQITVMISKSLVEGKGLNAGQMIRTMAKEIQGGGGGQAFFATAGGRDAAGLDKALAVAKQLLS